MTPRLPSRYEDLDNAFRGRLRPDPELIELLQRAAKGIAISGGLRFVPIFGESGSGKSSALNELGMHLPEVHVITLSRDMVESQGALRRALVGGATTAGLLKKRLLVGVVDQYEEGVATRSALPSQFVEWLSLFDRDHGVASFPIVIAWLTTSRSFQRMLADSTSRNRRILLSQDYEIRGPDKVRWPEIVEETFEHHNPGSSLADLGVLSSHLELMSHSEATIGRVLEAVAEGLPAESPLGDLSDYRVVMVWPVTDGKGIQTVERFVHAREGYRVDWNSWYRMLTPDDQRQLPLAEYNKARLYFDLRLVPIAAADLQPLCQDLRDVDTKLHQSYLDRLQRTHLLSVIANTWDVVAYSPMRERDSERARSARKWYPKVTTQPTLLGRRFARCLTALGLPSIHEYEITSPYSSIRADVYTDTGTHVPSKVLLELKAFSPENTIPSSIRDQIKSTLRKYAQHLGLVQRQ